jgi:hypothetical protein
MAVYSLAATRDYLQALPTAGVVHQKASRSRWCSLTLDNLSKEIIVSGERLTGSTRE